MTAFAQQIDKYLAGPALMRQAVAGMSREQLLARPVAGKWSTLEVVAHLSDFEPVYTDRMKRIISHDRPLLLSADEQLFATTLNYSGRDIDEELTIVESTRKGMGRILKSLPADAAARVGVHSYRGLVTLEDMLNSAVGHVSHHLTFIHEKRKALGIG